ncbi:uncharacterized protein [Triticum aestivum]|uniref:uncharacterized protein n=1 Tax=Triticum aestivum TaxID=4565 RepID=UPI001D003208|nr:uncharacterized protein LOC123093792 [Triticum aestivum]
MKTAWPISALFSAHRGRLLMGANLAIEGHASKICTRAMFGHIFYECGAYQVLYEKKNRSYLAIHTEVERKEKWCRVSYKVTMMEGGDDFDCECGQFAHMGILHTHVLECISRIRCFDVELLLFSRDSWPHLVCVMPVTRVACLRLNCSASMCYLILNSDACSGRLVALVCVA